MKYWGKAPQVILMLSSMGGINWAWADDGATSTATTTAANPATPTASSTSSSAGTSTGSADTAREALKQKTEDASKEKNLEQVFQATEKQYSLQKKGSYAMNYSFDYSFFRDTRIDIATESNTTSITRFRVEEDAQHSFTHSVELSYGLLNNLTVAASMPLIYKVDSLNSRQVVGIGDLSFSARWQPIPLKRGLPTTTLFGSFSTATGDSPYDININKDLSTGKGYYSLTGGASMSKVMDPIVIYGSTNLSMGSKINGINQARGTRILDKVDPGTSIGFSAGFAYSLNYDVSMSATYQQSLVMHTRFAFANGDIVRSPTSLSSMVNFTLSLRTNPKRIVNLSLGYGLTEDTPDVTLGFSMPIDFVGLRRDQ